MPAPHSYTRQDVVEIQTHGGLASPATLLDRLSDLNVRMAKPGEFTQRAFLLGRIDLSQAEAVMDVVSAQTKAGLVAARRQLAGALSGRIKQLRSQLVEAKAFLELAIDFPEEQIGELETDKIEAIVDSVISDLNRLLSTYAAGRLYREGAQAVIAGRPNVGKSSLLNCLLQKRRAIVTSIPGTTTDAVEEPVNIGGVPFRLVDTAGIREPGGAVEGEGVRITRERIDAADLIIVLCDGTCGVTEDDLAIKQELVDKKIIYVVNKVDKMENGACETVAEHWAEDSVCISAKTGDGVGELCDRMIQAVRGGAAPAVDEAVLTHARHRQAIVKGRDLLQNAMTALSAQTSPELIAFDLQEGQEALGEIIGETTPDDVLNLIFSEFCIGK
jgi:tRNA modification GTPase